MAPATRTQDITEDVWGSVLNDDVLFCRRIRKRIPVEFRLHADEARQVTNKRSGKTKLKIYDFFAALHRETWRRRFDEGHDYYMYIEHDIGFGPEQVRGECVCVSVRAIGD